MQRKAKSQQHFYPWVNRSKALRIYLLSRITLLFFLPPLPPLPPSLPSLPPFVRHLKRGKNNQKKNSPLAFQQLSHSP